jgi:hypothetical protein
MCGQLPAARLRSGGCSFSLLGGLGGALKDAADGLRRLRALGNPSVGGFEIDLLTILVRKRIIGADDFKEATVATATAVCGNDAVERAVLRAFSAESQCDHMTFIELGLLKWAVIVPRKGKKSSRKSLFIRQRPFIV